MQSTATLEELKMMVSEDYGIDQSVFDVEFSYLPIEVGVDSPPVVVMNDRQVKNFVDYLKRNTTLRLCLCVTFRDRVDDACTSKVNTDLNKNSDGGEEDLVCPNSPLILGNTEVPSKAEAGNGGDSMVKKGQYFKSKEVLQATLEMYAMKYNTDYRVTKSDTRLWCIRCIDNVCKWSVRAECLAGSTYFKINKYMGNHTCAPSKKRKICKTPSARTIGHLIMHNYEGVKEGPKPNDIINIIRTEYGFELTYAQAWESREYAVNEVRGIPEKSFGKVPKYLYMLQQANPGTHTNYEVDYDGRFKYLFISFGQSIRGFYKAIRRVILVDGTFLKSKYKGVLLVATAVDGNSNLYPIAFGIADTENDFSWDWFIWGS